MINKIIVESMNDKYIFEHLLSEIKLPPKVQQEVEPIENHELLKLKSEVIDRLDFLQNKIVLSKIKNILDEEKVVDIETVHSTDWFTLGGLSATALNIKIKDLKRDIWLSQTKLHISIIIDLDDKSPEQRLAFLNQEISNELNIEINITEIGNFKTFHIIGEDGENYEFDLAYFFIGMNGCGEIEDLLIELADISTAYHAEALKHGWRPYLATQEIDFKDKDFKKIWIDFYKRYDCLTAKQKSNAGKYIKWDEFLKKHPRKFDFSKDIKELNEIKLFLSKFCL